jgi:hypothetical protein
MWSKLTFRFLGEEKRAEFVKANGILLGTREKSGRKVFLYMVKDFFVEVTYQHDDMDMTTEHIDTFSNLEYLNNYLEKDFRASF